MHCLVMIIVMHDMRDATCRSHEVFLSDPTVDSLYWDTILSLDSSLHIRYNTAPDVVNSP